jgi:type II restriction enzyme
MTPEDKKAQIKLLSEKLFALSSSQIGWVESIINQFSVTHLYNIIDSDVLDECMLESFGDALLIHHCMSKEPFSKDKFEYVLERVANFCGKSAQIAPKGNPGRDITINGISFSLKTQADRQIRPYEIHISKFMELGHGEWGDNPSQLENLREQFIRHMRSYDRILSLRTLSKAPLNWKYELIEIPKTLLLEASSGELEMKMGSPQFPKPGYCYVKDENGADKFQLYFDGGGERKLQVRHIQKKYCRVHAIWEFPPIALYGPSE